MRTFYAIAAAVALLGLTGCGERPGQPGPGFGEAVRNNMAVQIIPPTSAESLGPTDMNGARDEDAFTRYETNKVIQPQSPTATKSGGGGATK